MAHRKIEIPYGDGDDVLELEVENLPEPHMSVSILTDQKCKINLWIQLALEYYRQGKFDAFELLLSTCLTIWNHEKIKSEAASYADGYKDRIRALDLLAIYYLRKGNQSPSKEGRRDYFARAAQKFSEVDKVADITNKNSPEYQFHLLGRAYCCLIDGKNEQANAQFNFVLQQQQQIGEIDNVPALLGKACLEFNKKEASGKRVALGYYKKALQICPNCPADVRLGLGICFYKLNMFEKAEIAFKKALSLDPRCVGALNGLAVIELNKKTNDSIKRGIEYLSRAFKTEPTNAMALTLLADHFFYSNEHEKVIKLATRATENTDNEAVLSQAHYQLGRAYHRQRDYINAFEYYYKSTTFGGSQSFLAHYGLGQMYIHRGDYDSAIQEFEIVLQTNPNNFETLKILASLYARSNSQSKKDVARNHLKTVTDNRPDDVESWVELASLCEQQDTPTALHAYRKSIELYKSKGKPVPAEIYNNLAALLYSVDQLDESEENYNLALKRCEEEMPKNRPHYESIIYTIKYNIGRLMESKHELVKAEEIYKKILYDHPSYIDCFLRLGCMERDKGLLFDASDRFKETFRTAPDNYEAWTLLGNLHFSKLELTPCQKKFEHILSKVGTKGKQSPPDGYSLVSIGNVWLQSQYLHSLPVRNKDKLHEQRERALNFYKYALKHDPKNIYAANGIGCVFAVKQMYNEARDIFSQVREATADFPDVWINIAHIYVEQKQFAAAVQMYENCSKKFYNNSNTEILLYTARALFKANKLHDCKKVLLRARHLCPYDLVILFNLARVFKTLARQIFEDRKSSYHQVVTAEYELKLAQAYFKVYAELKDKTRGENDRSLIDNAAIERETKDCADLLLQVERSIKVDAEQRDREEAMRRKEHEEQLKMELARKKEEEERKMKEELQRREELENKRRELLKKQEEAKQKLLEEHSNIINDDESDDGVRRKKQRTKKKESPEKERPVESSTASKKYKSRAILSSDSSSSSDDDGIL